MRFQEIHLIRFGRLRDLVLAGEDGPLASLVVVQAPNEGGKTTLFTFLTSLLYGFSPATREKHPYAPWTGEGDVEGWARIRLDRGEEWEIRRRLLSRPDGYLRGPSGREDLANRPLPWLPSAVPEKVYGQVFSLTLSEMARLSEEGWAAVQDRLVTGMGARDLRSARDVAEELEKEAASLWRPNRRGKQEVRKLRKEARAVRRRGRDLEEGDVELRARIRRLAETRDTLTGLREERETVGLRLEQVEELRPLRLQLGRLQELEARVRDPKGLAELPSDPREKLAEGEREIEGTAASLRELEEREVDLEKARRIYTPELEERIRQERTMEELADRAASHAARLPLLASLDQEIRDLERRCANRSRELFDAPWDDLPRSRLQAVSLGAVAEAVKAAREAGERRRIEEEARVLAREARADLLPLDLWAGALLLLLSLLLLLAGYVRSDLLLLALGSVGLALGGGLLLLRRRREKGGADRPQGGTEGDPVEESGGREDQARRRLAQALEGLPSRDRLLEDPPPDLPEQIGGLQEYLHDLREREERRRRLECQEDALRGEMDEMSRTVGLPLPADFGAAAREIRGKLEEARTVRERASSADEELQDLEEEKAVLEGELTRRRRRQEDLRERVRRFGSGSLDRGLQSVEEERKALHEARLIREEMQRRHPDLEERIARIREAEEAGADWILDEKAVIRDRAEVKELDHRIQELAREEGVLDTEVRQLQEGESVADAEGEAMALEEELEVLIRRRDRLRLLARILREADRRVREENQPRLVQQAGEYLSRITDGRYQRILPGDGDLFFLRDPLSGREVAVREPLSRGTREQVYLSLRLAAMDQLDAGGERLPLCVDEALVNWDRERMGRGLDLLLDVGRTRQVFFFTCQPHMARRLSEAGARHLVLP